MEKTKRINSSDCQHLISEAIRKIALGRSIERIDMSPTGTGGVGTARLIHGYVAKIHNDPTDEEYEHYAGTIDVGEFPDETASTEPIVHKGVLLSGIKDNSGGFLIIPTLFSDVTIVSDAATHYKYVVNYSHADIVQLQSHQEVTVGVVETEELDPENNDSPDYDELEPTGNSAQTHYTAREIKTIVQDKDGNESTRHTDPTQVIQQVNGSEILQTGDEIKHSVGDSEVNQTSDNLTHTVGNCKITQSSDKVTIDAGGTLIVVQGGKVSIGDSGATEPLVLGNELVQLMTDFIKACVNIKVPTMLGTMPAINIPEFTALLPKLQKFLSKTSFTK